MCSRAPERRRWSSRAHGPAIRESSESETGGSGSGFSLQLSRDPGQTLLYLMDGTNMRIWVIRRKDMKIMDRFGKPGRNAGEFIRAHMIAIDSKNRMYTGEAGNGRRVQRWILKGTKPAASTPLPAGVKDIPAVLKAPPAQ